MAVWIAAVAVLCVYLYAMPIYFALSIRITDSVHTGTGFSVFFSDPAIRSAQRSCRKKESAASVRGAKRRLHPEQKARSFSPRFIPLCIRLAGTVLKRMFVNRIDVSGRIAASDAAGTALLFGCAEALQSVLTAYAPDAVSFLLEPDFSLSRSDVRIYGMFSVRFGHIISASISHVKELYKLWKSTRLKAS